MFTSFSVLITCLAALIGQPAPSSSSPNDGAADRKLQWQKTIAHLDPHLGEQEFANAVGKLSPSDIHLPQVRFRSAGVSLDCGAWSGVAVPLDQDWSVVRESVHPEQKVKPGELVLPAADGNAVRVRIVGLADLRKLVDPTLWEAVRVIHRSPIVGGYFDPVNLIRAVNTLHAMGEERAVASMRAYYKLCGDARCQSWMRLEPERIIWIARLLYVAREGNPLIGRPMLGAGDVDAAHGSSIETYFPLVLQDDIPFCLVEDFMLGGVPEDSLDFVERCRKEGRFRDAPLRPMSDPITAAEALLNSAEANGLRIPRFVSNAFGSWLEGTRTLVRAEAFAAAKLKPKSQPGEPSGLSVVTEEEWREARESVLKARLVWKTTIADFERWK